MTLFVLTMFLIGLLFARELEKSKAEFSDQYRQESNDYFHRWLGLCEAYRDQKEELIACEAKLSVYERVDEDDNPATEETMG